MKLLDVNLLLYAVDDQSPHVDRARPWFDALLSGAETVGFAWATLIGFVRLSTSPRTFFTPMDVPRAVELAGEWLARPNTRLVEPGPRHLPLLGELLEESGTAGNLTSDAHLAALAIEQGATLCSADRDFGRFRGLRWHNPLDRP